MNSSPLRFWNCETIVTSTIEELVICLCDGCNFRIKEIEDNKRTSEICDPIRTELIGILTDLLICNTTILRSNKKSIIGSIIELEWGGVSEGKIQESSKREFRSGRVVNKSNHEIKYITIWSKFCRNIAEEERINWEAIRMILGFTHQLHWIGPSFVP